MRRRRCPDAGKQNRNLDGDKISRRVSNRVELFGGLQNPTETLRYAVEFAKGVPAEMKLALTETQVLPGVPLIPNAMRHEGPSILKSLPP